MRVAVISDIHGNLHALEAVLTALSADHPDEIWCLGDVVGYGPRPNECCTRARETSAVCLVGNHDLGVLGTLDLADFAGDAATAARWTRGELREDAHDFLASLDSSARADGAELYHASARDPVWEYVLSDPVAQATLAVTSAPVILVGHSHVALAVTEAGSRVAGGLAPDGTEIELSGARWLLNPGSVGQPRDGDPRAAYLLLDLERRLASFRRVPYAIERTQAEMRGAGLPEPLAERLERGE